MLRYPPDERRRIEREAQLRKVRGAPQIKVSVDEPEDVFEDLRQVWDAWWSDLGDGRMVGMAMSGLSWTDMSKWCEDHGITGEERLRWIRLFRAMDAVALPHWNRQKPLPQGAPDASPRTGDGQHRTPARSAAG